MERTRRRISGSPPPPPLPTLPSLPLPPTPPPRPPNGSPSSLSSSWFLLDNSGDPSSSSIRRERKKSKSERRRELEQCSRSTADVTDGRQGKVEDGGKHRKGGRKLFNTNAGLNFVPKFRTQTLLKSFLQQIAFFSVLPDRIY